jgi:hypothetical protein
MKKYLLAAAIAATLGVIAGCAPLSNVATVQQSYVQACGAYDAAFNVAVSLRQAGKLSKAEIDAVSLVDSQITPICTGPMPADPTAATQQITKAVTTLAVMTAVKASK